jgi:hypothetical protein
MALEDNQVLPAATGAGGMNPQLQAFINLLMGGGLHGFGGFGGQPFGGFGRFLMDNPGLMQGLGIIPHGAVPGPLPGASPVQDSTTAALGSPAAPAPAAPTTPSQVPDPAAAAPGTLGGAPAAAPPTGDTSVMGGTLPAGGTLPGGLLTPRWADKGGMTATPLPPMLRRG